MKLSRDKRSAISLVMISISIAVWVLLLINPWHILTMAHCSDMGTLPPSLQMLLMITPISLLLTGWALMVVAMMLPKLILPIWYIYGCSLKHHRFPSALLFVTGYVAVWMVAGLFLLSAILAVNLLIAQSYLPAIIAGIAALLWQFSPVKQRFLNRGHNHPALAAFGWPASRDALLFGINHGLWCIGSGWALMLFPMLLPKGHDLAMIIVAFVMLSEHLEHPQVPRWHLRWGSKLMRILFAQTQIGLKRAL